MDGISSRVSRKSSKWSFNGYCSPSQHISFLTYLTIMSYLYWVTSGARWAQQEVYWHWESHRQEHLIESTQYSIIKGIWVSVYRWYLQKKHVLYRFYWNEGIIGMVTPASILIVGHIKETVKIDISFDINLPFRKNSADCHVFCDSKISRLKTILTFPIKTTRWEVSVKNWPTYCGKFGSSLQ